MTYAVKIVIGTFTIIIVFKLSSIGKHDVDEWYAQHYQDRW